MTTSEAIKKLTQQLKAHSPSAYLDAQLLVAKCINNTRTHLFAYPQQTLTHDQQAQLKKDMIRREQGEPMAYILGEKEFWSLYLKVTPDTLIPRPESEHLVEWLLTHLPADNTLKLADLGTGSGAIAIALAHERPNWQIDAIDESPKALDVAKHNADHHQLTNIHFYQGHWCNALSHQEYSAIVSNPPYIAADDPAMQSLRFEPQQALIAGIDGLDAILEIITQAKTYLIHGGCLVLEHGFEQQQQVLDLLINSGYKQVTGHTDLAGHARFVTAIK